MDTAEIAIFGMGSFWEAEDTFARLPGVTHTSVGYTNGTSSDPTYHTLGDHIEAIRIEFDPHVISYEELLEHFWQQHDHTAEHAERFASIIFYVDETQRQLAEAAMAEYADPNSTTVLVPATKFHEAEDYHQKYLAKLRGEHRKKT
ncbi:MAG: peptide-methionine (S)-S-oxide reductase MsrA [Candidatus Saccharimonadales bacterium]